MDHLREGITFPIGLQILHLSTLAFEALPCSCFRQPVNFPVGKQNIEICAKMAVPPSTSSYTSLKPLVFSSDVSYTDDPVDRSQEAALAAMFFLVNVSEKSCFLNLSKFFFKDRWTRLYL